MTELYNTESPIDRKRRNNINATWDDILSRFANLQRQINILAGGQEVDDLIARLEQAIKAAEIDVQNYIIQVDESVQQAINKNNNALQTALQTVSETLDELNMAISNAEMATADATNAKNATIQATQDARDAINTMQSLIDNFSHRGTWSTTTQYYKNNLAEVDGRTYIALKENINTPVTNKSSWSLFADKGAQGTEGPRGLPGKDGKDGTGVNIIGGLTGEDELPTVGTPGDAYMIGGNLYVWQDDTGSWKNVGPIQGPEGKSAYDLAVENGFEGTMEEWIESLKGEIGPRGPEGPQGPPGQDADLTEVTEQLEQLEQTTENHITNIDKHLQTGERDKIKNALQPSTYNASNTITNVGANRATRVFPQVNWKETGIELWETSFSLPKSVWGILELDIAGFSAMTGAKIVIEVGISVPSSGSSTLYKNQLKVITATTEFTENFYVEFEHRQDVRGAYMKIYKRTYNDPINVVATFTSMSNSATLSAFDFLKGFHEGWLFNNIASVPASRQKDFDTRIKENFTSVSNGKAVVNQAVTDMGVTTAPDAPFATTAANIRAIQSGKIVDGTLNVASISPRSTSEDYVTPLVDFEPRYCSTRWGGACIFDYAEIWEGTTAYSDGSHTLRMIKEQVSGKWQIRMRFYNALSYATSPDTIRYRITN